MKRLKLFVSVLAISALTVNGQSLLEKIGKKVKDKVQQKVEERAERKAGEATDKAMDKTEDAVKKSTKKGKKQSAEENVEEADKKSTTSLESYSKFDFIPGEKVVFYEDFSTTALGDFPASLNTNGSGEVVTNNHFTGKWLRFNTSENAIWTDDLLKLPDNYTIEFDVIPIKGEENSMAGYIFRLMKSINAKSYDTGAIPGKGGFMFGVEYFGRPSYRAYQNDYQGSLYDLKGVKEDENLFEKENQKYHISVWVQKSRLRLYQDEVKLFDIQKAFPDAATKMDRIRFEEGAALISNIRIAVGAPDMRNKLMSEGKLVTYGIYFDVNKDVVKPESYGTLKEIAKVLNEVPDVKVKIVGHTDSDGNDASNLDLSKRRAVAVKNELVKNFDVNGDRLVTDGAGETQPVAKNDTPANKALNRRVEFIKM